MLEINTELGLFDLVIVSGAPGSGENRVRQVIRRKAVITKRVSAIPVIRREFPLRGRQGALRHVKFP